MLIILFYYFVEEISFINITFIIPFIIFYKTLLHLFFKITSFNSTKIFNNDKLRNSNDIKNIFYLLYININLIFFLYIFIFLISFKGYSNYFFWKNFYLNNYNLFLISISFFLSMSVIIIFKNLILQKINYTREYFFSLINISVFSPFIFICSNLYSLIFLVEFLTTLIFYKLVVSKINTNKFFQKKNNLYFSKKYINMIFYHFWMTFFSSIVVFYFFNQIHVLLGSTDLVLINYIFLSNFFITFFETFYITVLSILFIIFFFIKVGISPIHLFKVEIYESIPFYSILFYTTFYISYFFIFFVYSCSNLIFSFLFIFNFLSIIVILVGFLYLISFLFSISLIKSFFAYSTIINIMTFLLVLILVFV